jgi:hypothetical protein
MRGSPAAGLVELIVIVARDVAHLLHPDETNAFDATNDQCFSSDRVAPRTSRFINNASSVNCRAGLRHGGGAGAAGVSDLLNKDRLNVRYTIHPVAGRMYAEDRDLLPVRQEGHRQYGLHDARDLPCGYR